MNHEGTDHLKWITWFQVGLLIVGLFLWGYLRSGLGAMVFLAGGATSLSFWGLHRFLTARMLTPSVRRRWLYAFLSFTKLALIAAVLRGMIARYPEEALPLATGILLFVGGILLEAIRLVFHHPEPPSPA